MNGIGFSGVETVVWIRRTTTQEKSATVGDPYHCRIILHQLGREPPVKTFAKSALRG